MSIVPPDFKPLPAPPQSIPKRSSGSKLSKERLEAVGGTEASSPKASRVKRKELTATYERAVIEASSSAPPSLSRNSTAETASSALRKNTFIAKDAPQQREIIRHDDVVKEEPERASLVSRNHLLERDRALRNSSSRPACAQTSSNTMRYVLQALVFALAASAAAFFLGYTSMKSLS